jgi:hypothetical protein
MSPRRASVRAVAPERDREASVPFDIVLGPYRLSVQRRDRSQMLDRRQRACINLDAGRIELRKDLAGLALAEAFLFCLIRLGHYCRGCQRGCPEEAYAHAFATGMVEFALRNPRAWLWFNRLLGEHLPGRPRFDRVLRGASARVPVQPQRIVIARRTLALRCISRAQAGSAFGWYDHQRREVQLYVGLAGVNLPVVGLHEITHALHHAYALKAHDTHLNYCRAQTKGWLDIMRHCPAVWRWLLWTMRFPFTARLVRG